MGKNFQWLTFQTVNHITEGKKKGFVQALRTVSKKNKKKKQASLICRKGRQMNPDLRMILHVAHSISFGLFLIILFFYNSKLTSRIMWGCGGILGATTNTAEFVPN